MTILMTIVIFIPPVLSGSMFIHLLWPERDGKIMLFKFFLGIGVGLGIFSMLYFLYLFPFAGGRWFVLIELAIFLILLALTIWKEKKSFRFSLPKFDWTHTQIIFFGIAILVFIISLLGTASYLLRHQQGDWDAWMMFNRAARFTYRDQTHWLESFSRQMDPIFHADYPLLLAMNISSGWDTLGTESARVPMIESGLFAIALLGILVSALASVKSIAQAALGLIVLWGTPAIVVEGSRELADIPVTFFMLATFLLIYFFVIYKEPRLIILAGLTAGLAAWTKNEGTLFVLGAGLALVIAFLFFTTKDTRVPAAQRRHSHVEAKKENLGSLRLRAFMVKFQKNVLPLLLQFILGLAFPFAIVMAFKFFLAPPSDVLRGTATATQKILTISRHLEILQFMGREFLSFGGWTNFLGIIPVLVIYFLLFRMPVNKEMRPAYIAGITILVVQLLGDYGVYLITPYDLTWHLSYSIERIVLQVFPMIAFLILCTGQTPENIFEGSPKSPDFNSNQPRRQKTSDSKR